MAARLASRAGVLVDPDVDVLVGIAGLGREIGERLAEMLALRWLAEPFVEFQMGLDGAGTAGIGAYIKQHERSSPYLDAVHRDGLRGRLVQTGVW